MNALMDVVWYIALALGLLAIAAVISLWSWVQVPGGFLDRGRGRLGEQYRQGTPSPHLGKLARVRQVVDASHLWVEVEGELWPARLPPFTPTPPEGETVRVIKVVPNGLIVKSPMPETPTERDASR